MSTKYKFNLGYHGDICLDIGESCLNLGYNYSTELPFVPWLHNLQVSGKNIFTELNYNTREKIELDEESREFLGRLVSSSRKFPLKIDEFNKELGLLDIGFIYAGNNRIVYEWQLKENGLLVLCLQENPILELFPEESLQFASDYLDFQNVEDRLIVSREKVQGIIRILR